jgi:hypothetical protein
MLHLIPYLFAATLVQSQATVKPDSSGDSVERIGAGASDMVYPVSRPFDDALEGARNADSSGVLPFSLRLHQHKGAARRDGNGLRDLVDYASSDNKVDPRVQSFSTPHHSSVFKTDFMWPLNETVAGVRAFMKDTVDVSFVPAAAMTWQHATKVLPGMPHGKGLVWYGADGKLPLWGNEQGAGQVIYNLQGNAGVGSPFRPIMGQTVGNPLANNNIIISSNFGLYMLYWQQSLVEHRLRIRVGKMEAQVFFDRNAIAYDPIGGFLAQNFNQSSTIPFPEYGFAGVVSWDLTPSMTIRGGVYNSSTIGITAGFDGLSSEHLFKIVEFDNRSWLPMGDLAREGHQRFIAWHTGIDDWQSGQGNTAGWGFAFNMDQAIANNVIVFLRAGYGDQHVTAASVAVSTGFAVNGILPKTDMGVAIGWSKVTQFGRDASRVNAPAGEQLLLEWYLRTHLSPTLHVGPVVQAIRDPSAGIDTSVIYGVRSTWTF